MKNLFSYFSLVMLFISFNLAIISCSDSSSEDSISLTESKNEMSIEESSDTQEETINENEERIKAKRDKIQSEWMDPPKKVREENKAKIEEERLLARAEAAAQAAVEKKIIRWAIALLLVLLGLYAYFYYRNSEHKKRIDVLEKETALEKQKEGVEKQKEKREREVHKKWTKAVDGLNDLIQISEKRIIDNQTHIERIRERIERSQKKQDSLKGVVKKQNQEVNLEKKKVSELRTKYPFIDEIIPNRD